MKFLKRGFTIIEIIVALAILSIVITWIVRAYIYMLATNKWFTDNLNFQNYSQYASSLIDTVNVWSQPQNTPFYLKFKDPNTVIVSTWAADKAWDLNFFAHGNSNYWHEFMLVWSWIINSVTYKIYTLETFWPNNQSQKTYVTK
jgi:prepilin-type N-terminal cleavage/methylation domain-containing protein